MKWQNHIEVQLNKLKQKRNILGVLKGVVSRRDVFNEDDNVRVDDEEEDDDDDDACGVYELMVTNSELFW